MLQAPIEGVAEVLDGDTIQIAGRRVRLFGIDAFEAEQFCTSADRDQWACGGRATRALADETAGKRLVCVPRGMDAFNRQLAVCRSGAVDLSSWMVRHGHAVAFVRYTLDYEPDEAFAREAAAGAWAGAFDMPWNFRQGSPVSAAAAQRSSQAEANCAIKGNVNAGGERIYHQPGDRFYLRTKPEAWFCSSEEAEAAGFRRAES